MVSATGKDVAVCLLTYNHVNVVELTIDSILNQSIEGYEIILSDDCSTDGTWERIQTLAASDSRIKAVRTPRNMGMPGNANHAVSQTNRRYVALLHHDDIYRYDLLEKWLHIIDGHPQTAFVFNAYGVYESDFVYRAPIPSGCIDGQWFLKQYLLPRWGCVVRGTGMVRRSAWNEVGGMREPFGLLADIDLWMRFAMRWDVGYVDEPLITVRHARPDDYPDEYKGGSWSWHRQRLLYEIHAFNRLAYWRLNSLSGRLKWWGFRLKLSLETTKWLVYAVVRKKHYMIASSNESATSYDLWPLQLFRWFLQRTYPRENDGPPDSLR